MNNPLEANEFRLYLNFKDTELDFGMIEITEPIGFDASTFGITQDSNRYGRDVEYGNIDIELEFQDVKTQIAEQSITLPNGVVIDRLTMGLDFLLFAIEMKGFETEVEFIIRRNDVDFTIGVLDLASDMQTDMTTYLSCKVIQNTEKALIKRRSELKVDLFSNEDLDGNNSEPVETHSVLLRAKPTFQESEWVDKTISDVGNFGNATSAYYYIPLANNMTKFGIENSYVPFDNYRFSNGSDSAQAWSDNKVFTATDTKTNVKIRIEKIELYGIFTNSGTVVGTQAELTALVFVDGQNTYIEKQSIDLNPNNQYVEYFNDYVEFNFDVIYAGQSLALALTFGFSASIFQSFNMIIDHYSVEKVNITSTSTQIDSVSKGVRHIDLIKGTAKRIGSFNVIAPRYDIGGEFYNNFVFNGFMIRQFLTKSDDGTTIETIKPFYNTWKDTTEQLPELNSDWQVLEGKDVFIGNYKDYYPNKEIGAFIQEIDDNYTLDFNERYQLQAFNYKYQDYEQDKQEQGTLDAVHTEAEFMIPNRQVEGNMTVEVPYTRDPFRIESTRRLNFRSDSTTSTSEDDRLFIVDCIELPEGSTNTIKGVLNVSISNDPPLMKILADESFNWLLVGFQIGDPFYQVLFKLNGVSYGYLGALDVLAIEPSMLTLTNDTSPFENEVLGTHTLFMTLEYPLTDVDFVIRTNEGFDLIENVAEPETYGNLQYTIRRNMRYWESFIRTSSFYNQDKIFKNTYWKANGELITKLDSEQFSIKENESVNVSNLDNPVVTPIIHTTTIIADFEQVLELIDKMNEINDDNTIGGFVRVKVDGDKLVKGYIKTLEYTWATQVLELTIEQKYESDYTEILRLGDSLIQINQVGYDSSIVKPLEYKAYGNFVQLFDKRGIPLNKPCHYSKYKVVGDTFNNVIELTKAIDEIW